MSAEKPKKKRLNIVLSDEARAELLKISGATGHGKSYYENFARQMGGIMLDNQQIVFAGREGLLQTLVLPDNYSDAPASIETKPINPPALVTPATGLTIGVFGESAEPSRIEIVSNLAAAFAGHIIRNVEDLNRLTPNELEDLVAERFAARG
jgi:hypothetical protein